MENMDELKYTVPATQVGLILDFEMPWHTAQVFTSYFSRAHFLSAYTLYI